MDQFGDQLRQVSVPFSAPVLVKIPPVHKDAGQNGVSYPKKGPGKLGLIVTKALGSEKTFDCKIAGSPSILS